MEVKGNINIRSIATIGRRANEGMNTVQLTGTIQLDKYSSKHQYYTTSTEQVVMLPDALTLPTGWCISIYNAKSSSAKLSVHDFQSNALSNLTPKKTITYILLEKPDSAGVWREVKSGGSGTGSQGNVLLYSKDPILTKNTSTEPYSGPFYINPFVANVMDGIDEGGEVVDDTVFNDTTVTVPMPSHCPADIYVYMDMDGHFLYEDFRQEGGNVFPSDPVDGKIFFLKPLRRNYKYSTTDGWEPYPCVAICEIHYDANGFAKGSDYPKNEWWWDYKYGEIRNTAVISSGTVLTIPDITSQTPGGVISGVLLGNLVTTVADGYTPAGVAVDHFVPLPVQQETSFTLGTPTYLYVLANGTVEASTFDQGYVKQLPADVSGYSTGAMVYSGEKGRNYKFNGTSFDPYPAVLVASVDALGNPTVYPFNTHPFDKLEAYSRIFTDANNPTTTIVLDTEVSNPDLVTVNVGNTVLQSDQYFIHSDNKTIDFLYEVEAGVRIEVRWYSTPDINVVRTSAAHSVGEVFWSQSSVKADNKGALPLFTGEDVAINDYSALYFFLLRNPALVKTKADYDALIADTTVDCPYYAIDNGRIYLPVLRNYLNTTDVESGVLGIVPTTLYPWVSYITTVLDIQTPTEFAKADLSNVVEVSSNSAVQPKLPVGSLMMGPVATMDGYLLCNGQAVSRTTYAALFAAIGTNFGVGDGSTTFNVPDYRGCFLRGLGGDSAADMYTKQPMGAPNIEGEALQIESGYFREMSGALYRKSSTSGRTTNTSSGGVSLGLSASLSNSVYGAANEIRPTNFAVNFFIKY